MIKGPERKFKVFVLIYIVLLCLLGFYLSIKIEFNLAYRLSHYGAELTESIKDVSILGERRNVLPIASLLGIIFVPIILAATPSSVHWRFRWLISGVLLGFSIAINTLVYVVGTFSLNGSVGAPGSYLTSFDQARANLSFLMKPYLGETIDALEKGHGIPWIVAQGQFWGWGFTFAVFLITRGLQLIRSTRKIS